MTTRQVLPVRSADIDGVWSQVESYIARALAEGGHRHSAEDVRRRCRERDAHLWLGVGIDGLEMVAVTEIQLWPGFKVARIWLLAGENIEAWIADGLPTLEAWARAEGCREIEEDGRGGWARRLPGWSVARVIMRKGL
jgi:hypothetical protein